MKDAISIDPKWDVILLWLGGIWLRGFHFFFFREQKDFVFSLSILFEHNGSDASLGQLVTCE